MTLNIHIVCGATCTGKSARAIEIAQAMNGVIINADAMQVYAELSVLTARPSPQDLQKAPHLLYGVLPAREACSAGRWLELAAQAIDKTHAQGKLPIVTGGTGFYLKALMQGLSGIPDVPSEAREQAVKLWNEQGAWALRERDPLMDTRLRPSDRQRHIRALEVFIATGKSLAYWQFAERRAPYGHVTFRTELVELPREELYRRCDARFIAMMDAGALEEVKALLSLGLSSDLPAMRAVGVPELTSYLEGSVSLDEAIGKARQATRNYAKRQMTWFRHQLG